MILPSVGVPRLDVRAPINAGIQGFWPLTAGAIVGSSAVDLSSKVNTGSLVASAPMAISQFGQSISLNGSTQWISLGTSTTLCPPAMSVAVWVKAAALTPAYSAAVSRVDSGATNFWQIFIKSSGKLAMYFPTFNYDGSGTYTLSTGQWYLIGFSFDTAISGLVSYVNGLQDATVASGAPLASFSATAFIGHDSFTASRELNGVVSLCRIWNRALSAAEWRQLYSTPYVGILAPRYFRATGVSLAPVASTNFFFMQTAA